jgi:ferredoxin
MIETPGPTGASRPHVVTIENTGETFRCNGDSNVLAAMEHSRCTGIPVGCRNGGCGACKVHVTEGQYLKGKMNRAVVSAEEEAHGCVLACKLYPHGDITVKALGRVWGSPMVRKGASFSLEFARPAQSVESDKET